LDRAHDDEAALRAEMQAAHCGALPERALPGMALAQRYRDAIMAERALAAGPSVLILGAGHAGKGRDVPAALERIAPGIESFSIALIEVAPERADPAAYGRGRRYDALWFTPRASIADPCAAFRTRA
ncbi:MAG: ChaN family lipoprotein, partial [Alphaproteobacteria bacterium]|nr:ChaN family lipoprotein [Alphaproteobacteria bacterium]